MKNYSPLRYAGGKTKAIKLILEHIPDIESKRIISPFFGGGSFELYMSRNGYEIIGFDIFNLLVNFWNVIINDNERFVRELKKLIPDDINYTRNRHILLNYWNKIKPDNLIYKTKNIIDLNDNEKCLLDDNKLLQAVYYYYNHQLSYGPAFIGWGSSVYLNDKKYNNILNKINGIDLGNVNVYCDTFENVIKKYNNDFLYLDPPYYLDGDSKMFKGIYPNSNFAIHHKGFNHDLLCELLKKHKGGFILTYNNCEYIREKYKDFKQVFPEWNYSFGNGETRIGKNRDCNNIKKSHEIFIIK